jgi:phosphoribosylglycinamide formyltransferase-1
VPRLKTAVLISGRGSNLQALLDAAADPAYPAEIVLVLSNVPGAYGLERAKKAGIATAVVDHKQFPDRPSFERALDARLKEAGAQFLCLAGFMRLLTPEFVTPWQDRLINIHPSLLPSFKGLHTHERALAAGVRFAGCTVHFVRPATDDGPIIIQAAVPVHAGDTPDSLAARVLEAEHRIYPLALALVATGRARVAGDGVEILGMEAPEASLINPVGAGRDGD